MTGRDPAREFLQLHLTALGGVIEMHPRGLEALLPVEVAESLGVPEEVRFSFGAEPDGTAASVADARLGSPVLERAVAQRRERHPVAAVAIAGELPRPLPDHIPVLLNAVRGGPVLPAVRHVARYLVTHLRVTLQGDEVRSVMFNHTLRLEDGAAVSALRLTDAYAVGAAPLTAAEQQIAAASVRGAVRRVAPQLLGAALEAIRRRAQRDLARMAEYYASLDTEMARAAERARSEDERARRWAKRAMLADELAARRAQVRERLSARVSAELIAAVLVESETDRTAVPIRRRTRSDTLLVQRRAADGALEGPKCAGCGVSTLELYLCDERLHVLCNVCGQQGRIDAARCVGCRPRAVPPLAVSVEDVTASLRLGGGAV
jgi:hypothetical protein